MHNRSNACIAPSGAQLAVAKGRVCKVLERVLKDYSQKKYYQNSSNNKSIGNA